MVNDDETASAMCIPMQNCVTFLASAGLCLLTATIFQASTQEARPLSQLGQRPKGRGLVSFIYHHYTDKVGVNGYDPIQGALSPPLRLLAHISAMFFLWAILLFVWPFFRINSNSTSNSNSNSNSNSCGCHCWNVPDAVWHTAAVTVTVYSAHFAVLFHVLSGVSLPCGPRPHKISRQPAWNDRLIPLPALLVQEQEQARAGAGDKCKYKCVSAQESHEVTDEVFRGTGASLTGEAAGRDIWTGKNSQSQSKKQATNVDERLVQKMASGGRAPGGFNPALNPNSCDIPLRAQMIRAYMAAGNTPPSADESSKPATVKEALHKGVHFYSMLQSEDGHWSGDYGGPLFLMPGLIVAWYIMGRSEKMLGADEVELMKHYLIVHQQTDGGWGTHIESPSTMFGTTLNYVALRLLGMDMDDPVCVQGRTFMQDNGGAVMTSSWAKFYLCLLGCMHWDGHNSVPPEMWLLPNWFPFHPGRMWCHARMVYLPMGYVYGSRIVYDKAETDPIVLSLRKELYCEPYDSINWIKTRHLVAPMDNYSPINTIMSVAHNCLARYETWSIFQPLKNFVRKRGLAFSLDYMKTEDLMTNFIDIGPVNKVLNMISMYHAADGDVNHPTVVNHMVRVADYLWVAEDGMKMKGYNGSQCWDTSFAVQAIFEADLLEEFPEVSRRVWSYLERCQILSTPTSQAAPAYKFESAENRSQYYRHVSQGGWPFSTSAHGWPISDCTGEGLKGVLALRKSKVVADGVEKGTLKPIGEKRLQNAVEVLLSYQNEDGGFATYENDRGFGWYESLNPSEVFGDIMIDYSYVECSMASLTALADFREAFPKHRSDEVRHAIDKGRDFLKSIQRDDGSWYGSWACCFTYAGWFGIEGLIKCGEPLSSKSIKKACQYLLRQQRSNGGWGEDFTACYDKEYAQNGMEAYGDDGSGVVNTSWALLALAAAQHEDIPAVKRAVAYLMQRQLPCGDWPQEGIAGVFNRACGITYTSYRNVFPIWALGRCRAVYGAALDE